MRLLAGAMLGVQLLAAAARAQDSFDLDEAIALCASCHGEDGVPVEADYPIIWGQQFYYLYVQLRDYEAGRRANAIMQPIAAQYSRDQMKVLAQYFSEKPWPDIAARKDPDKARRGRTQAAAGQCSQCHNTYMGDSRVPRVAGQQEAYLSRTMLEFKNKIRLNAAAKGSLLGSFEDTAIEDLAHFLATL
jgi:cytochrome c553